MYKSFTISAIAAISQAARIQSKLNQHFNTLAQIEVEEDVRCVDCHYYDHEGVALAQLKAAAVGDGISCTTAYDRIKAPVDDFWSIRNGTAKYTDSQFTAGPDGISWSTMNEGGPYEWFEWKRAQDAFSNHTIFGDGISPGDIDQGQLGNCWALSSPSAIAEKPGRMDKVFLNTENVLNAPGIYGLNMYALGVPTTIIVDDYIPTYSGGSTYFTSPGKDTSMWVPIYEKAFAKYHGNYVHTRGGDPSIAVRTIVGSPNSYIEHGGTDVETLWTRLSEHDGKDDILQAGTPGTSDAYTNADGLVQSHAYTVIGVKTLSTGDRLVKLRNPHGRDSFHGDWSDESSKWTDALRQEAGQTNNKDDGFIFMSIQDYKDQVQYTTINIDPDDLTSDYFLMLGDDGSKGEAGVSSSCGSKCTMHTLTITSDVAQTVYVTAHTWDNRGMPQSCVNYTKSPHVFRVPWMGWGMAFRYGATTANSVEMTAGQTYEVTMEMNWSDEDQNAPHDWSVVAQGTAGAVRVTHNSGVATQHMPVVAARDNGDGTTPGDGTDGNTDGTDGNTDGTDGNTDGTDGNTDGTDGNTDGTDGNTDGTDGNTDGTDGNTDGTDGNTDGTDGNTDGTDGNDGSDGTCPDGSCDGGDGNDGTCPDGSCDGGDGNDGTDGNTDGTDGNTDGTDGNTDGTDGNDGSDGTCPDGSCDGGDGNDGTCPDCNDGTDGNTDGTDGNTDGTDGNDGSDGTDPAPTQPIIEKSDREKEFDRALEAFEPTKGEYGCKWGWEESYGWTDDWEFYYYMMLKTDCDQEDTQIRFRIMMAAEEWDQLQYTYFSQDATDGSMLSDTSKLISNCKDRYSGFYKQCDITLGYYANYAELGLSTPWQTQAGYINPVGGYGYATSPKAKKLTTSN